jgi:outer membrane protein
MKYSTLLFLTIFSCSVGAAGKLGFINTKALLESSPQAQAANEVLKSQFGPREQSLRKLAESIQQMEKNYKNDSAIMSAEQKQKAEDIILQSKRKFQFEQQSLKEDLTTKQRELLQKVQVELRTVIQAYGKAEGYEFIFTDASVAYATDAVNVTEQILTVLKK